jgi:hypothetical protein
MLDLLYPLKLCFQHYSLGALPLNLENTCLWLMVQLSDRTHALAHHAFPTPPRKKRKPFLFGIKRVLGFIYFVF